MGTTTRKDMMVSRTVRTTWKGSPQNGFGHLELGDLKVGVVELARSTPGDHYGSFPAKHSTTGADRLIAAATPDELIAASYAASFTLHLVTAITHAGGTTKTLEVFVDAHLVPEFGADHPLENRSGITIAVHGEVEGLDEAGFAAAASTASTRCPIGKALAGMDIRLATILD